MVLASFLWGLTFVFQSQAATLIDPFTYNGIRMLIGALVLCPVAAGNFNSHRGDRKYCSDLFTGGLVCGLLIAAASVLQQYGIGFTTAGRAGFITSLYSLFVPVASVLMGRKVSARLWLCVLAGLVGAFLLSTGAQEGKIGKGDLMIFFCAILFTFQILAVDRYSHRVSGSELSFAQFVIGGAVSLVLAFIFENVSWVVVKGAWIQILYAGVFSCGIAYTLQIVGQRYVVPAKATLILCLESVWAAVGGALLLHETMTAKELFGCALMLLAVVLSQLDRNSKAHGVRAAL